MLAEMQWVICHGCVLHCSSTAQPAAQRLGCEQLACHREHHVHCRMHNPQYRLGKHDYNTNVVVLRPDMVTGCSSPDAYRLRQPYQLDGLHGGASAQHKQQPTHTTLHTGTLHSAAQQRRQQHCVISMGLRWPRHSLLITNCCGQQQANPLLKLAVVELVCVHRAWSMACAAYSQQLTSAVKYSV